MECSVIRPIYSTPGSFFIAGHVILELVEYLAMQVPEVHKVLRVDLENGSIKVYLHLDIAIEPQKITEWSIDRLFSDLQRTLRDEIEYKTGFYLGQVVVNAKKLWLESNLPRHVKITQFRLNGPTCL